MTELRLLKRRVLSPTKLKAARLHAQFTNVAGLAREIGMDRSAYIDWENPDRNPLTHVDFVALTNALTLFGVTYDAVSDPLPEAP